MNGNQWYQSSPQSHRQPYNAQDGQTTRVDPFRDARRLLAAYPFASATPSTHVSRHLTDLSLTAAPPSYYVQPVSHSVQPSTMPQAYLPQYTGYANEIQHMNSSSPSYHDNGYWDNVRADAARYLGDQSTTSYYQPSHWSQESMNSTYQTTPFAQSVFQYTAPSSSYPTPPPPGITTSSSSLALALGEPIRKPARTVHQPAESTEFFNSFLAQQTAELSPPKNESPRPQPKYMQHGSPDPLGFSPSKVPATTPRKRKAPAFSQELQVPSAKRGHALFPSPTTHSASPTRSTPSEFSTPSRGGSNVLKRKLQVFVELPPVPKAHETPNSLHRERSRSSQTLRQSQRRSKVVESDDDDLGGFSRMHSRQETYNYTKSPSKRTAGERDERGPLEKFATLLEDIFEAEDTIAADADVQSLSTDFFSPLSVESSRPLLHPNVVRKLTNYIGKVARPSKRMRISSRDGSVLNGATPRGKGRIADMDSATLSRVLRILERGVKAGEDLDPFGSAPVGSEPLLRSPTKASKKAGKLSKKGNTSESRRSQSKTPRPAGDDLESTHERADEHSATQDISETDLESLTRALEVAKDSVLSADCCIALLASDRLTKQLYSEELISACLSTIKNQLTKILYPFVEATSDILGHAPPLLKFIVQPSFTDCSTHRRQLAEIFHTISSIIPRINDLISADTVAMSEGIIIQAVYIAIGPFFVVEPGGEGKGKDKKESVVLSTLGSSAMRGLRLDALSLIRSIFAKNEDQRAWIIEEILSSLIKLSDSKQKAGQFRLRDGRSIRTVSALLLQLVQTSAHDVRVEARALRKTHQQLSAIRPQESMKDITEQAFLDAKDMEEIRLYTSGLDSATKAAKTIILFLTQRSGKSKTTKNSNEAEYRTIFDNLISDLLTVLFWPEWPAASLLLSVACKFMVASLDDIKTSNQNDNNAAKTVALDHLGVIAARLRSSVTRFRQDGHGSLGNSLKPLDEILSQLNLEELQRLLGSHKELSSHLCKRSSEDQAYDSARELTAVVWGQELAIALKHCRNLIEDSGDEDNISKVDRRNLFPFGAKLKEAVKDVWQDVPSDVFDLGSSQEEVIRVDRLAEEIGTIQSLRNSFHPILNVVLLALDAPAVFMRTKALKALGQIVTSDPSILSAQNVRRSIESHLLDSSPAVRDAAVELIGKYMIDSPEFAGDYYQKIAERIADTGLGVRKRVIKLLKSFYGATEDTARRVDIGTRLVLRILDEDDTVKDLAVKTIEELWFQDTSSALMASKIKGSAATASPQAKAQLLTKVTVIMGVSANFKDRQSPLEDLLHQIIVEKDTNAAACLHERYAEICETLIDGLVDASDLPGFTVVNCVRTIHLFTVAHPAALSSVNVLTLLPYLKNATTAEEQATSDYLLRIYRASIPHLPKTAVKFGQELQMALQPMILKPSAAAGVIGLQETVACMCAVVQHLTHDFGRLVALLRSCNARMQQTLAKKATEKLAAPELRALSILTFIAALLCEHCDFDLLRTTHADLQLEIETITPAPVIEHVYQTFLRLYEKYTDGNLRSRLLQCLGFLFRAQPALLTAEASAKIMDAIFASPEEEGRGRLLKILQDFLVSEAMKHSAKEKEVHKAKLMTSSVNMEELVGNTNEFAESGVSSAVVQRYIDHILAAALSQNAQIQGAAVDILSFTIKQGLAHPLQSFPVIVALETSPNPSLSSRANALHAILHSKHTSLLNTRYVLSARASFDYQKSLSSGAVQGHRMLPGPTALLQRWYTLVREKRATRQDFLKALVKVFDIEAAKSSQDDVLFTRYMAENFATFDYKTQEEVLTVLKYLTAVLSTTGMQLVEVLSPAHLLNQLHGVSENQVMMDCPPNEASISSLTAADLGRLNAESADKLPLARSSVIVAIVMLLKTYLKTLYGLSEEKCSKWVIGKKSAIGDRPAARRHDRPISFERLPFASAPVITTKDMHIQFAKFLEIWSEDGLTAEPEDEFAD